MNHPKVHLLLCRMKENKISFSYKVVPQLNSNFI